MKTLRLRLSMLMLLLCCLFANLTPAQAAVDSTTAQDESSAAVPTSPFNDQAGLPVYPPEEEHSFAARIDRSINCSIQKRPFQVIGGLIAFFLGVIIFLFYCLGCKCSRICRMLAAAQTISGTKPFLRSDSRALPARAPRRRRVTISFSAGSSLS